MLLTGEEKRGRRETVTWEQIEAYLAQLGEKGCSAQTLSSYRWDLRSFWESLPQGELDRFTVLRWQEQMREKGYRMSTIKHRVSSANRLLAHLGLWEFQSEPPAQSQTERQPQLTRREYLQLLRAARSQGKTRTYLLIKVFACTGMPINNLERLTVESLDDPELPDSLAKELREFAGEQGLTAGPVFLSRSGQGIGRANVTASIQRLAGLPAEKCNPGVCSGSITPQWKKFSKTFPPWSARLTTTCWNRNSWRWGWGKSASRDGRSLSKKDRQTVTHFK